MSVPPGDPPTSPLSQTGQGGLHLYEEPHPLDEERLPPADTPPGGPSYHGLEIVAYKNTFYEERYRNACWLLLGLLAISLMMLGYGMWLYRHRIEPTYIPTLASYKIIEFVPVDKPVFANDPRDPDEVVARWTQDALLEVLDLDPINYLSMLYDNRTYFTRNGLENFWRKFKASNNFNTFTLESRLLFAEPMGRPSIIEKGLLSDRYFWRVKVPIKLIYQDPLGQNDLVQMGSALVLVIRVDNLNSVEHKGLAMHAIILDIG